LSRTTRKPPGQSTRRPEKGGVTKKDEVTGKTSPGGGRRQTQRGDPRGKIGGVPGKEQKERKCQKNKRKDVMENRLKRTRSEKKNEKWAPLGESRWGLHAATKVI